MTPPITPPSPVPGTTWTPTRDAETTFARRVVCIVNGRYPRVRFQRKLSDGAWGIEQGCKIESWRQWVRKHTAVLSHAPPDPRDAEIKRLRSLLTRALDQHEDENGLNEGYGEHWAEMARKALAR